MKSLGCQPRAGRGIFSSGRGCGLGKGGRVCPEAAEAAQPVVGEISLRPQTGTAEGCLAALPLPACPGVSVLETRLQNPRKQPSFPKSFSHFAVPRPRIRRVQPRSERRHPRGRAAGRLPAATRPPFARLARSAFPLPSTCSDAFLSSFLPLRLARLQTAPSR